MTTTTSEAERHWNGRAILELVGTAALGIALAATGTYAFALLFLDSDPNVTALEGALATLVPAAVVAVATARLARRWSGRRGRLLLAVAVGAVAAVANGLLFAYFFVLGV